MRMLIILSAVIALVAAEASTEVDEPKTASRLLYRRMYRYLIPVVLALKVKVAVLAIALALSIAYIYKIYYAYSSWSGYSSEQPWISGRSLDHMDITQRIMRGLDMAELSYRAFSEDHGQECRTRLACEARRMAKDSGAIARVVNVFSSSVAEFDSGRDSACEQLGCSLTYNAASKSRR